MQEAWIAFARSGNPSCEALGEWPVYGPERRTMLLGEECRLDKALFEEERQAWEGIPNICLG
jgi:para-nitrobenzyl esterase